MGEDWVHEVMRGYEASESSGGRMELKAVRFRWTKGSNLACDTRGARWVNVWRRRCTGKSWALLLCLG